MVFQGLDLDYVGIIEASCYRSPLVREISEADSTNRPYLNASRSTDGRCSRARGSVIIWP